MTIEDLKAVIVTLGKPTKITIEIAGENYQKLIDSVFLDKGLSEYTLVEKVNPRIHCFGCTIEFIKI